MTELYRDLLDRITTGKACVGIIGLGYVGVPLARAFAGRGFRVLGFDTDPVRVAELERGESGLAHVPNAAILELKAHGFEASGCFDRLGEPDALLMCVPTPLTVAREPNLTHVTAAAEAVAARLRRGQLVVLESTTYPGTTRQIVLPLLEAGGLRSGRDFFLAYSPEREDPGNSTHGVADIPRVVGAIDSESLEIAAALYAQIVPAVVRVSSAEVAEASKLLENTYRAVNIALANELKVVYDRVGIDFWEVIEAARTKPFGFQAFYPGPGPGGNCIPINPHYVAWLARKQGLTAHLIEQACAINTAMPAYVMEKVIAALGERRKPIQGARVLVLGVAYKKDVGDLRESPGLALLDLLRTRGAVVEYNDPHVPQLTPMQRYPHLSGQSQPLTGASLAAQDCIVIVTDHSGYDWDWIVAQSQLVIDTRNATRGVTDHRDRIIR